MHRRAHRANLFAARILAVLARHRLEVRLRSMQIALEVRVDPQPLHVASNLHLLAPDNRNIVLRIAAHDAGIAAHAAVQVDRHPPRVLNLQRRGIRLVVLPRIREERVVMRNFLTLRRIANLIDQRPTRATFMREVRVLLHLFDRGVANDRPLHRLMPGQRVNAFLIRKRLLKIMLREGSAVLDVMHLRDAQVILSRHLHRSYTRKRQAPHPRSGSGMRRNQRPAPHVQPALHGQTQDEP